MNIWVDFHHSDLWWSFHQTLVEILGHTLYVPRGMEWFNNNFCSINSERTIEIAKQFLVGSFILKDNKYISHESLNGCLYYPEFSTLNFEESKDIKIDLFIVTLVNNELPIKNYRDIYHPNAKIARQIGNPELINTLEGSPYPNMMFSVLELYNQSSSLNKVFYHQKFDTENIFKFEEITNFRSIRSFLTTFRQHKELVKYLESHLELIPEFNFLDFGITEQGGNLNTKSNLANEMMKSTFVWHVKTWDGYGHIFHNAFAMGRPLITRKRCYEGHSGGLLMDDEITCLVLDPNDIEFNAKKILNYADPVKINELSINAYNRFLEVVDWEKEAQDIQRFLDRLI